jgi:trk system potassium uptake protein TrkH
MYRPNAWSRWELSQDARQSFWQKLTPPQLFTVSFALLILAGAAGLRLLPGISAGQPLSWVDSVFMSTSAVCVTGLAVVDPGTRLTFAGQAWLVMLVQFGGLGILTFTSLIITALGRRMSIREESLCIFTADTALHLTPGQITRNIIRYTLVIEAAGAIVLYVFWGSSLGWWRAIWPAIFHSVSAFCNAGFSTFTTNLIDFQQSPGTLLTISALIVLGGLGFLTHEEILQSLRSRKKRRAFRMSVQSRIILVTTAVLLLLGWALLTLLEWDNTLAGLPVIDRLINGLFMSVTARTAGFNSIDYNQAADSSNFVTMLLMMIGGSPGSTAGGLKTTTVALIFLMALSRLRGRETTTVWYRTIPEATTSRAVGLFTITMAVTVFGILLLTISEQQIAEGGSDLRVCMFEAISAFNTVGLSMGITPGLSAIGKCISVLLMFFGRVGPLTVAAALTIPQKGANEFRYANEDVVVG